MSAFEFELETSANVTLVMQFCESKTYLGVDTSDNIGRY